MNHEDTKGSRQTEGWAKGGFIAPKDVPAAKGQQGSEAWGDVGPFRLARAIIETARRCVMDRDPTPYTLVVPRRLTQQALHIWKAISYGDAPVSMTAEPDQGCNDNTVLLFTKNAQAGEKELNADG